MKLGLLVCLSRRGFPIGVHWHGSLHRQKTIQVLLGEADSHPTLNAQINETLDGLIIVFA